MTLLDFFQFPESFFFLFFCTREQTSTASLLPTIRPQLLGHSVLPHHTHNQQNHSTFPLSC